MFIIAKVNFIAIEIRTVIGVNTKVNQLFNINIMVKLQVAKVNIKGIKVIALESIIEITNHNLTKTTESIQVGPKRAD